MTVALPGDEMVKQAILRNFSDVARCQDAIDRYFAREADRDLAANPDAPTYSMSEVVASIFEEEPGKGAA